MKRPPDGPSMGRVSSGIVAAVLSTACSVVGYPAPQPSPTPMPEAPPDGRSVTPGERDRVPEPSVGPSRGDVVVAGNVGPYVSEPLSASGNPESYEVFGRTYRVLRSADGYVQEGRASWYGEEFAGRPTSSGEIFDPELLTAAHRTLPLPSWVEVENLENGRRVVVRVNDRGPFAEPDERILDLSEAAARELRIIGPGHARVRIRVLAAPRRGDAGA